MLIVMRVCSLGFGAGAGIWFLGLGSCGVIHFLGFKQDVGEGVGAGGV